MTDPTGFVAADENGGNAVFADGKKEEKKEEPQYACLNGSGQQVHCHTGQPVNNGSNEKKECKGKDDSGGCGGSSQTSIQGTVVWTRDAKGGANLATINTDSQPDRFSDNFSTDDNGNKRDSDPFSPPSGGINDKNNPIRVLWNTAAKKLKKLFRGPDYVTIQANVYVLAGGKAVDLSTGKTYGTWGLSRNYPGYSKRPGFSIVFGSIVDWKQGDTHEFLTGAGNSGSVFIPLGNPWLGAGGGWNHSYGGKTSVEYGVGTPGAGVSPAGYGWEKKE